MPKRRVEPSIHSIAAAGIFKEMVECRREYCSNDKDYPKMNEFWEWQAQDNPDLEIQKYLSIDLKKSSHARLAYFAGRYVLSATKELFDRAGHCEKLGNFVLAHELSHLALGHLEEGGLIKNFKLQENDGEFSIAPPTDEELEADFGAICFQCGIALLDDNIGDLTLAKLAHTEVHQIRKARKIVRRQSFRQELARLEKKMKETKRVVL